MKKKIEAGPPPPTPFSSFTILHKSEVRAALKGVGGGGASLKNFFFHFLTFFQNLDYGGSGTFYGIEKANRVAEI